MCSHLFCSHRQHAAALLHPDWLVLGPRAERSGTQAAEQMESQDRRRSEVTARSNRGQTGSPPAPIGADSRRGSSRRWTTSVLSSFSYFSKNAKKKKRGREEKSGRMSSLHFSVNYEFLGKSTSAPLMPSCFGRSSQRDVAAEESLLPSFLKCLSDLDNCSHDISQL